MKYPWILFDADDTLFDFHQSANHAFTSTLENFNIAPQNGHFEIYKHINNETWRAFEKMEITTAQLRRLRFEKFLDAIGEWRDPLEMNGHYLQALSQTSFLMNGASELIAELLNKKYKLGLITNGLKEVQRPRIAQANMAAFFEVIVVSDEIGVSKPQAGFFEHTFAAMNFPEKSQVLVVGDSLHSDILGGNNYGLHTCWFNHAAAANLTDITPTYHIQRLSDLMDIV